MVKKKQIFRLQLVFTATVCKHKNKIVNRVLKLFSGQQMAAPPSPSNKCKRLEYFKRQNELRNCVATVCVCVWGWGGGWGTQVMAHKLGQAVVIYYSRNETKNTWDLLRKMLSGKKRKFVSEKKRKFYMRRSENCK